MPQNDMTKALAIEAAEAASINIRKSKITPMRFGKSKPMKSYSPFVSRRRRIFCAELRQQRDAYLIDK
jgi:hypothetical protein